MPGTAPASASRSATATCSSTLWMLALTGPISMHCAPSGAMKRASEVPPPVLSSGALPAKPCQHLARRGAQRTFRRVERFAAAMPVDRVIEAMRAQHVLALLLQLLRAPGRVVAQVEQHLQLAGDHVVGAGAGVHVADLQAGRRETCRSRRPSGARPVRPAPASPGGSDCAPCPDRRHGPARHAPSASPTTCRGGRRAAGRPAFPSTRARR